MIWVNNYPGGRLYHGRIVVDSNCHCADCIVEESNGLLEVGPPHHPDPEVLLELENRGYVGIYRIKSKPWKGRRK